MNELENLMAKLYSDRVRRVTKDAKTWFVLKDVAEVLEYLDHKSLLDRLSKDGIQKLSVPAKSGKGFSKMNCITSENISRLVIGSSFPISEQILNVLKYEVLSNIIEFGSYGIDVNSLEEDDEEEDIELEDDEEDDIKSLETETVHVVNDLDMETILDNFESIKVSKDSPLDLLETLKDRDIFDDDNVIITNKLKELVIKSPAFKNMKLQEFEQYTTLGTNKIYQTLIDDEFIYIYETDKNKDGKSFNRYRVCEDKEELGYFKNQEGTFHGKNYNIVLITPEGRKWFKEQHPDLIKND